MSFSVCIITQDYVSATPRVVKEADALHAAGFDVRVVFSQGPTALKRAHDADLLARRPWRWTAVRWGHGGGEFARYAATGLRQKTARAMPSSGLAIAARAEGRVYPELARSAAAERASLYIGHYPAGLAAAAWAARRNQARWAYDAEDYHTGQTGIERERTRIDLIQGRLVPGCAHVTASSEGIAAAMARDYGITCPTPIHNCFPWADRAGLDGTTRDRRGPALSLYWYSQTIGLDRGIQDVIRAAGLIGEPVQVHLRGTVSDEVRGVLKAMATEVGLGGSLYFHEQMPPDELLSLAAEHDVGLALEPGRDENNCLAASNKLFSYLLAGLAVVATDVPGQRSILHSCRDSCALYTPGDVEALAAALQRWARDPDILARAKAVTLDSARIRWNWEREAETLVRLIKAGFSASVCEEFVGENRQPLNPAAH